MLKQLLVKRPTNLWKLINTEAATREESDNKLSDLINLKPLLVKKLINFFLNKLTMKQMIE